MKTRFMDITRVIRSKNAGPYELTLDIIFKNRDYLSRCRKQNIINKQKVSELYRLPLDHIADIIYFEEANAVKITMKRVLPSGSPGDTDVYGAQQHAPLLELELNDE